jgi:ATP-dependent DNA ligase
VELLATETPSSFIVFDLLAADGEDLRAERQVERRAASRAFSPTPSRRSTSPRPPATAPPQPNGWNSSRARGGTA